MRIVEFKKPMTITIDDNKIKLQPKSMYLFSDVIQINFQKKLLEKISSNLPILSRNDKSSLLNKLIKSDDDIDKVLTRFNVDNINKFSTAVILRTGGIGDLLALSSLVNYIKNELNIKQIKFISQSKYKIVFDWFESDVDFISYFTPTVSWKKGSITKKKNVNKKIKPIFFEGLIENSSINWFELQYNEIGAVSSNTFDTSLGRPKLKTKRISKKKSNIDLTKKSILLNPRSTSIIRSMRFEDMYNALIKIINDLDCNIYVHSKNIKNEDVNFISKQSKIDNRINVIHAKTLEEFLLDAYDTTIAISVDSAIVHFREGIQKPCIGIYGQFTTECRTKYYKHTHTFDIKSDCPHMPCFVHVKKNDEICEFQRELMESGEYDKRWYYTPPCFTGVYNNTLIDQLVLNMKDYINKNI